MEAATIKLVRKLVGILATVAPSLVLAFLAAGYLLDCFWSVFDPSQPLDLVLPTEKGAARLRAARWSLDLARRKLVAYDVTFHSPEGDVIAAADHVIATGPGVGRAGYDVWTRGAHVNVERLRDGRWRHYDLLPPEQEEPSKIAFTVHVEEVSARFTDRTSPTPWTRFVNVRDARIAGVGGNFLASFDLEVPGAGRLKGHARSNLKNGLSFDAATDRLALSPLLDHFREAKEGRDYPFLKDIHADDLVVSGRSHSSPAANGGFGFRANLTAKGRNASYGTDFRARSFEFRGLLSESGLHGRLAFADAGARGEAIGGADWSKKIVAAGKARYAANDAAALPRWLRAALPAGVNFSNGRFDGWISYRDASSYQVDGKVNASAGSWTTHRVGRPDLQLAAAPNRVAIEVNRAEWLGGTVRGRVELAGDKLSGMLTSQGLSLQQAARLLGRKEFYGGAEATAILGGTTAAPQADLRLGAVASFVAPKRPETILGNVDAAARFADGRLRVERLSIVGPNGVVTGRGVWNTRNNRVEGVLRGDGIVVSALQPGQEGTALLDARIVGTVKNPKASGRAELFGAVFRDRVIPFVGVDFDWDGRRLLGEDLVVDKGVTSLRGTVAWRPNDGSLSGRLTATGVLVADWLTGDYGGAVDVPSALISGTVGKPTVTGTVEGRSLVAQGLEVDRLRSAVDLSGSQVALRDLQITTGKGELAGEGNYNWQAGKGRFSAVAKNIDVGRVTAAKTIAEGLGDMAKELKASGSISADLSGELVGHRLDNLTAEGTVKDAALNAALLGNGDWSLSKADGVWSSRAFVGQLERFVEIPRFTYEEATGKVGGEFIAYQFSLQNVMSGLSKSTATLSQETRAKLASLDGAINSRAVVSGQVGDPDVDMEVFEVDKLDFLGQSVGKVALSANRHAGIWNVASLSWESEDGLFRGSGTVDERGTMDVSGSLKQFRIGSLGLVSPDLATLPGTVDFDFTARGPLDQPDIDASLTAQVLGAIPTDSTLQPPVLFYLNLRRIEVRPGIIRTAEDEDGAFTFRGIPGKLSAAIPFDFRVGIPKDRPVEARVWLAENRTLNDLAEYAPWLDVDRSSGTVGGGFSVKGTIGDLVTEGAITLDAKNLAFKPSDPKKVGAMRLESSLTDAHGTLALKDGGVNLDFSSRSSRGGTVSGNLKAERFDLLEAVRGSTQKLLSTPVSGSVNLLGFGTGASIGGTGKFDFEVDGRLGISGSARAPSIEGSMAFFNASGTAPSVIGEAEAGTQPTINPRFDVSFRLAEGARVRASTADVVVHGSGALKGSLYRPSASANLEVDKGTIRLPNARIKILEGGTMRFDYRVAQDGTASPRLDIDLNGETSVTALRFGDTLERYNISMRMTGNLLAEGQVNIAAHSDPPDLTHERIMAILGQSELLQGLAQGSESTLATYAIPAVIDPITQRLGSQLGLEYVNLEYDLWQRTTITAARSLGGGFTLMGRRQISTSSATGPQLYDYRLTYRLPFAKGVWRSFSFSFGVDQDRPWKAAFEFGKRF